KSYIAATQQSERDNEQQRAAAKVMKARGQEQQDFIGGEKTDVGDQQGKLTEADVAQKKMVAEGDKASGETQKGQDSAKGVDAEGRNVEVAAKPEEPSKKGWLERAWDATGGALWHKLVQPAIRAVKRKVAQVMKAISDFITKMINSALGLDEI